MISNLLAIVGMLSAVVVCAAFAAAGPLLALHDRMPVRLEQPPQPTVATECSAEVDAPTIAHASDDLADGDRLVIAA